ncbi:parallel beta-helix repeat protein [Hydrogenispora ethanolica]|uniref:Parallel beta-helix repeat protein n=1 Tax=Hydrogenispora ethanolica TaxID=1082276 RepID=A0A4R1R1M4_HYDET|nr:right-handed parallel beta-helix repeat-containing protein [Hydrogenispora ethanolica]TCL59235.1 parallel beta-helix repeat protein [Hydrogenispora ethanolica]
MNADRFCLGCMTENSGTDVCPHCGWKKTAVPESALFLRPGTVLKGRYLIGRVLGYGGFGITYLAYDLDLHMKLAIKEYLPHHLVTRTLESATVSVYSGAARDCFAAGLQKFITEARMLAKFNAHPCIVSVYGFFKQNGTAYMVMEYVEGITFHEYLDRAGGRIAYDDAAAIMLPVIDALQEVHAAGILHRDISPDNIYMTKYNQIKLLDFGAARYAVGERSKTVSVLLKPGYAPLEQYQTHGDQGPWTDVYGVAATLYRAVSGVAPVEALARVETDPLRRPSELGAAIPPEKEAIVIRALSVKAKERYQTMKDFRVALWGVEAAAGVDTAGAVQPKPEQHRIFLPWSRANEGLTAEKSRPAQWKRHRGLLAASGLFLLLAIIGMLFNPPFKPMIQPDKAVQSQPPAFTAAKPSPPVPLPEGLGTAPPATSEPVETTPPAQTILPSPPQAASTRSLMIYVRLAGNDANPGTSWRLAKRTVGAALGIASPGDAIWVAAGTYTENIEIDKGIKLFGGFAGKENGLEQRNSAVHPTILDGNQRDSVMKVMPGVTDVRIDGFIIQNGKAENGGGISCMSGSETKISHSLIRNNTAGRGGGINAKNKAILTLEKCIVTDNTSDGNGGGILCFGDSQATFAGNTIRNNTSDRGGGIYLDVNSKASVTQTIIDHNTARVHGGGIWCGNLSSLTVTDTTLSDNRARSNGGGIYLYRSGERFTGNIIRNNAAECGGGIFLGTGSDATMEKNIIERNTASLEGGGIYSKLTRLSAADNTISGNQAVLGGGGIHINQGSSEIIRNVIHHNRAGGNDPSENFGGGIECRSAKSLYLAENRINDNQVDSAGTGYAAGGGIFIDATESATITNCQFYNNQAVSRGSAWPHGGAIAVSGKITRARIYNCVVAGNSAENSSNPQVSGNGGGIVCKSAATLEVINSTLVKNRATFGGGLDMAGDSGRLSVVNTIVAHNSSGFNVHEKASNLVTAHHNCYFSNVQYDFANLASGTGDRSADPKLIDYPNANYRLDNGSPCIDAGDDGVVGKDWTDASGSPRLLRAHVDIGAFERN